MIQSNNIRHAAMLKPQLAKAHRCKFEVLFGGRYKRCEVCGDRQLIKRKK